MNRDRFFLVMPALFLAVALVGFSRSFFLHVYFDFPELPMHLYVHGIALTAWFVLALLQPLLVATGRTDQHRRLGMVGAALAIGVVMTGLWTVGLRDAPTINEDTMRGAGNIASVFMFASCVSLGVLFRRKAATHKRLMLMASIPVLAPALDRLARIPALNEFSARTLYWLAEPPEVAFALICFLLLLITMVVRDLATERRLHQGTIWGLVAIFVFALVETYAFTASGAWVAFVRMIA